MASVAPAPQVSSPSGAKPARPELQLTETQIDEFREAFGLFDKDGDGHVTAQELKIVMQTLGQEVNIEDINAMIDEVDDDGNREIEFEEFCHLMVKQMAAGEDEAKLREAFRVLDSDGSGAISREELKVILQSFAAAGEPIEEEQIDELINEADLDGDGQVSYDEFTKVMMRDGGAA